MDKFCGSAFWNASLTWYTNNPDFTLCFQKTVLIWVPCMFLWIFSSLDIFYAKRSQSIAWDMMNIIKLALTGALILLTATDISDAMSFNSSGKIFPMDYWTPLIKIVTFLEKTVPQQPQIVYEERVVPKVVYEKRIVPQVVVEKKIVVPTVIQPALATTTTFTQEAKADKQVESGLNVHKEVNVVATPVQTQGSYGNINYGYSSEFDHQAGSKFINDIFNIPIATLQAVNRLVSNKVASGGGNIDIQKTITVNHS